MLSRIVESMAKRNAKEAVLYVMGRDQMAEFKPFAPEDSASLAAYLGDRFNIESFVKYVAVVLLLGRAGGRRFSEFYPITPSGPWPDHVVKEVVKLAISATGYEETTFEGETMPLDDHGQN